ncbi:MAG: DNA mismatch repair protein MutS [Bacteroidota bacterium]
MRHIDQKTLDELEFNEILAAVAAYATTEAGKHKALNLKPLHNHQILQFELNQVNEMLAAVSYDNLPAFSGTEIGDELRLLRIENALIPEAGLMKIKDVTHSVLQLIAFFEKKKDTYPNLHKRLVKVRPVPEIITAIDKVLDRAGKVKSSASKKLEEVRAGIGKVHTDLNRVFNKSMLHLQKDGWLSDTQESFVGGRRVLSVLSEYKRKVDGHVMGISNTGKVTYIEPAATIALNNELVILENEELLEINRILLELAAYLRQFYPELESYQEAIIIFDLLRAKGKYAFDIGGVLPEISPVKEIYLVRAYHPILMLRNKQRGVKTIPQTLHLSPENRMLVISGPNAGGKSITLKTVGLLQLMLQSGLLVPCKEYSRFSFFDKLLTDIGDNQSIENELSTYSYRLKQMKNILKTANSNTLVLMDEFGTGSDPELGGALAEVFFKELHQRKSYGVITTHYGNIKLMAGNMAGVVNGCMLFDRENLAPLFELSIGQPGSSFTFEVAQKIGMDMRLINEAKKRVRKDKLNFDHSLADLQKTKADIDEMKKNLSVANQKAEKAEKELLERSAYFEEKFDALHDLQDKHNKEIQLGKKLMQFIYEYDETKKSQKEFVTKLLHLVTVEKAKEELRERKEETEKKVRTQFKKSLKKERKAEQEKNLPPKPVVVGASVKMAEGGVVGVVKEIVKDTASVLFGDFLTKVKISRLTAV